MDRKRGLMSFMFIFAFAILSLSFISAAECSITTSCAADRTVMKLSSTTNAHGALYNQGTYTYYLCCDFVGIHTCSGSNVVLRLSATSNAHAERPQDSSYSYPVCFGDMLCTTTSSSCTAPYIEVISLSATTNAHLAQFSSYGTKICCNPRLAICGNGFVESGETCDDSNTANGDCCNSNCQYESSGSSCPSDSNACTNDVCNGAGTCTHPSITCNDNNACTTDTCNTASGCVYTPMNCADTSPCTTDFCSSGSCVHNPISNCCTLNSQCNDNNACTAPDTCNSGTNTCSNPTISSCTNGDGCCPSGCSKSTDNDCTTCTVATQQADCNDNNACTTQVCSSGLCTNPPITSCTNGDGCCPSGCNAVNDNNCVATCGNGAREAGEECDGTQLGGATCASLLGSGYTGTLTCYADGTPDECEYNTAGCIPPVPPCALTSASWSVSTPVGSPIVEGTTVSLNIAGTNCNGKTISFDIREKDSVGTQDVTPDPASIVFPSSGTTASRSWVSVFQDDGVIEGNPPEYYFTATTTGSTYTSPNANVNDAGLLRVSELLTCGNGAIDGTEECDEGTDNGVVCSPPYGGTCTYCSGSCADVVLDGAYCGDNTCNAGNEDCSNCVLDCGACPSTCTILDAYWNVSQVVEGAPVRLNVEASNCGGETVTFEVFEDDNTGDDAITSSGGTNPSSILSFTSSGNLGYVDWNAFYMEDTEIGQSYPPEFYFTATILTEEMDSDLLEVLNAGACAGVTYCADYATQETCDPDACEAGENEPTCDETPIYDPITRCTITPECDCQWNTDTLTCEPENIFDDPVCDNLNCGNGRLDEGEICDGTFLQLSDNSCSHFDEYTTGTVSCYPAGSPYECTYNFEDCGLQSCGNGVREVGEECDDWNNVNGDGCDENCLNENAPYCGDGIVNQASEVCDLPALQLTDDSCTHFDAYTSGIVGCYAAGTTYECTYDFSDCANQECGNGVVDGTEECEPPSLNGCDASCMWEGGPAIDPPNVGQCAYSTSGSDTCASGITFIERTVVGIMMWDALNNFPSVPAWGIEGVNIFFRDGAYRYDPSDQYTTCITPTTQSIQCPSMVELPFFGWYQATIVIAVVGLIYLVYVLRKNSSKKPAKRYKKRK